VILSFLPCIERLDSDQKNVFLVLLIDNQLYRLQSGAPNCPICLQPKTEEKGSNSNSIDSPKSHIFPLFLLKSLSCIHFNNTLMNQKPLIYDCCVHKFVLPCKLSHALFCVDCEQKGSKDEGFLKRNVNTYHG